MCFVLLRARRFAVSHPANMSAKQVLHHQSKKRTMYLGPKRAENKLSPSPEDIPKARRLKHPKRRTQALTEKQSQ